MNIINYRLIFVLLLCSKFAFSQNPVIKDAGVSDPHVRVFNDTIYLYSGHDSYPNDKTWIMKDWRVFSTTDLIQWKKETTISPKDNYMGINTTDCWATDAAERNGQYYFYFSDGKRGIGVMTSKTPGGHFTDALWKPMVSPMHDPTILIDNDKTHTPYLIYGDKAGGGFHIAELNNDLISLAESPKPISIVGKEWENAPSWMDKNYLFKYNDNYYLSWGRDYATSKNIYGPYTCVGAVGTGHHLNEFAHGSFFWWKGQFYHIWCYYLKSGFKFRETIISYCHLDNKGHIVTDTGFLDKHLSNGVGQYDAGWDKIEAEWFYEISGDIHKQGTASDGFVLSNIKDNDWVKFANVSFDRKYRKFVAKASLEGETGCIEIRIDSPDGKLLGIVDLTSLAGADNYQDVSCKLLGLVGKRDVFLKFRKLNNGTVSIDWFKFR